MVGKSRSGEAKIEKRGDSYRTRVRVGDRRVSITGQSIREVQRKRRELLTNADKGILPPTERLTVQQYMERWLEDVVRPGVRDTSYRSYEQLTRLYILPALGNLRLNALQPGHVQKLHADMQARGLSRNTVQRMHRVLHNALNRALEWGYVSRNVSSVVHPPTPKKYEFQPLTPEQVRRLLETALGTRWEVLIALAVATSLREGELLGLQWGDIDLDARRLVVRRQLGPGRRLVEPKSDSTRRSMQLPVYVVKLLREHRARQNEARLIKGHEYEDNDLVFATYTGQPLIARNVFREYKTLLRRAGLPDIRFHDLRHTAATLMLLQGVPVKVVQERLGHSQISLTLGTYSHVLPSMDQDAADKMDALLG